MKIFNKKYLLTLLAVLSLSFLLVACGQQEEGTGGGDSGSAGGDNTGEESPYEMAEDVTYEASEDEIVEVESDSWKFITEEVDGQVQYEYAQEFAERIEAKTNGAITVETYEYGGLGTETDQVTALQEGAVQLAIMSPGFTGNMVAEGQIFSLHFLFPDSVEDTQEILDTSTALNEDLAGQYEEYGINVLDFWTEGATQWTSSDVALETPEDFEGFLMRIQPSPLLRASYEAYGAEPTDMPWGELYTALDRKTVQGQENPIFFIGDASFHEVQEYLTLSNHNNYVAMTTANSDWFQGLDETKQALVTETIDEMSSWIFDLQSGMNEEWITTIEEDTENPTEIIELTEEQRNAFRELAIPVRDFYREEISTVDGSILDTLEEEISSITGE